MAKDPNKPGRFAQIRQAYQITKESDPKIGWILLGWFVAVGGATLAVWQLAFRGFTTFGWIFAGLAAVLAGLLAVSITLGRRGQRAALAKIEGQPGAAAAALGMLRKGWKTDPAIGFTKQQDFVHRVVGPPGIVLIGEGNPNRLRQLLNSERKRHERVTLEVAIHEVIVGYEDGQVPLHRLTKHVTKLGRNLKPRQMTDVLQRIRALDANRPNVPLPKGPVPTSMKGARKAMRGR